jgi:pimeloyl-ACP methyl ester carboxylesterase
MLLVPNDTLAVRGIAVAPAETLQTTVSGAGRPLVVIPGLIGSAYAFRKVTPPLRAAGYRVIVIEPLGIGHSSRPERSDYSLTAQARRVGAVLDSLGETRCALVLGHSHGVSIGLRLAHQRPDRVCGLLAVNGGAIDTVATSTVRRAARYSWLVKLVAGRGRIKSQIRDGLIRTAGDPAWITREVVDSYAAGGAGDPGAVLRAVKGMARAREPALLRPVLPEIRIPVALLIGGAPKGSGIPAPHTELLRATLPRLTVDTVPGAGLHIHEEQPDAIVRALLDLAKRAYPPGPARPEYRIMLQGSP